jgi:hypothetical protein
MKRYNTIEEIKVEIVRLLQERLALIDVGQDKFAIAGIIVFLTVPIIGVIISVLIRPFFHQRFLIPVLGISFVGKTN